MKWVGLTGGIACGKSTVSRMLREIGFQVVDADQIAHEVVRPGSPGLRSILHAFGVEYVNDDGSLNRRKLGQDVFGKPQLLNRLESILHPLIEQEVQARREELKNQGLRLALYDIPLLFEKKAQNRFDALVVVSCTLEQQKERLRRRHQWSEEEIEMRMAAQIPVALKEKQADFVVRNNRDEEHLKAEVFRLVAWLNQL
ncbi:MAG: dephospho-CoA kinase [Bdellovibrio sp.]